VFKGATRPALKFGVPLVPLMCIIGAGLMVSSVTTLLANALTIPVIAAAGALTRTDDQIYRQLWLWFVHRVLHRNRSDKQLQAAVYSPMRS